MTDNDQPNDSSACEDGVLPIRVGHFYTTEEAVQAFRRAEKIPGADRPFLKAWEKQSADKDLDKIEVGDTISTLSLLASPPFRGGAPLCLLSSNRCVVTDIKDDGDSRTIKAEGKAVSFPLELSDVRDLAHKLDAFDFVTTNYHAARKKWAIMYPLFRLGLSVERLSGWTGIQIGALATGVVSIAGIILA